MINLVRATILLVLPAVGFMWYGKSTEGLLIGVGLAAIIIAITIFADYFQMDVLVVGSIGVILGLTLTHIGFWLVKQADNPGLHESISQYSMLIYLSLGLLGGLVGIQKRGELDILDKDIIVKGKKNKEVKILDSSVLIDGRIADIAESGFLTGKLLVPRFVLHEVQMVADSADSTRRQRGRRGLDILKRLQEMPEVNIKIYDKDYSMIKETDSKILELAKDLGARVATTDFNLNKVAALQGISVLNVNELAGALKPVVLPGDPMAIFLAKEGKERAQAVGYLDDGTMVVVDEAKKYIGKRASVIVNSILQTSAGRMIFARLGDMREDGNNHRDQHAMEDQQSSGT
jgi:uncharacterized protein YacL